MRALSGTDLLLLWEQGAPRHALDRDALLAAAARPDLPPQAVVDLPLGMVTESLLAMRVASFGARLDSHVDCPHCGQRLGFTLDLQRLMPATAEPAAAVREVDVAGMRVRAPCLRDLAAIANDKQADQAARRLLQRCILDGNAEKASAEALQDIEAALEAIDPHADLALALHCVACGHDDEVQLDAGALLWDEIDVQAQRLLHQVHQLAAAYGWHESDILALSAARRGRYLAMVAP